MDFGYSMVHTDRENQKPVDWADAMGQNICVRYLMMYETCCDCVVCVYGGVCASLYESVSLGEFLLLVSTV